MVFEHDYENFPELTNRQIQEFGFSSPHTQIEEDFDALVVRVHDGDTITLRIPDRDFDFPLRLLNIDAPEMNAGGKEARDWLRGRILGKNVTIQIDRFNRVDKYGRLLGSVLADGIDVAGEEISLGLATTFESRRPGELPNIDKMFNIKKWL